MSGSGSSRQSERSASGVRRAPRVVVASRPRPSPQPTAPPPRPVTPSPVRGTPLPTEILRRLGFVTVNVPATRPGAKAAPIVIRSDGVVAVNEADWDKAYQRVWTSDRVIAWIAFAVNASLAGVDTVIAQQSSQGFPDFTRITDRIRDNLRRLEQTVQQDFRTQSLPQSSGYAFPAKPRRTRTGRFAPNRIPPGGPFRTATLGPPPYQARQPS